MRIFGGPRRELVWPPRIKTKLRDQDPRRRSDPKARSMNTPERKRRAHSSSSSSSAASPPPPSPHDSTPTALLRQKDERIARLETELSALEHDFAREVRHRLSQAEAETSTFWQAKHSALHRQFLRTDAELR
ncbi:hypothetical protein E4U41_003544, partial [Claviceps citrina]